ncbi:MAG: DoxX family protein [Rhodospirillaceae bacterium]|nr:DoxX family protein [Rhodospirillaceae bacterium]MCA8932020.1 DoxX family protein [Rhodospirillaceae bacterium]
MIASMIRASMGPDTDRAHPALRAFSLVFPYLLALFIAYVFLHYLPFKFAPGSALFQTIEDWAGVDWVEPYFRNFTGGVELLASILLFVPGLQVAGAALALGTMSGAICLHLFTPLGVDPYNDGGTLFKEACTVWVFALTILAIRRREVLPLVRRILVDPRFTRS